MRSHVDKNTMINIVIKTVHASTTILCGEDRLRCRIVPVIYKTVQFAQP